ncbi:Protein shuttle craft [Folsomia candida]|uniref:Protein shuttle craft n=1 Tax=Folsomia candida TaxID=158441 RepID=A0A226DQ05_FOLCA|nr:Protein shuttle craft [Folsomia candida]
MSFENGVFLPDPDPPPLISPSARGRRQGGSGAGGHRGSRPRQNHHSRSPRSIHHASEDIDHQQQQQTTMNGMFSFNPDAPSFQPFVTGTSSTSQNRNYAAPSSRQRPAVATFQSNPKSRGFLDILRKDNNNHKHRKGGGTGSSCDKEDDDNGPDGPDRDELSHRRKPTSRDQKPDIRNQRERLTDQLGRNAYDCMICVERVRRGWSIWSCMKCFNVFHLKCVSTWALSSKDEVGWRCPGCQSYYEDVPHEYRCFCGKTKNPENIRSDVPHGCGNTCGKVGSGGPECNHSCSLLCHPGPCPPCEAIQSRQVFRYLPQTYQLLTCHCKSENKSTLCDSSTSRVVAFSCGRPCDKLLSCQNHKCSDNCHVGACDPCSLSPEIVLRCPCGQTSVTEACRKCNIPPRKRCLDPIPVCGKVCGKSLPCGGSGVPHKCSALCHANPTCPTCPLLTNFKCRCGSKTFELSCAQYDPEKEYRCEKRCTKKKSCGRHKCNAKCCIDEDHICVIVCDRPLRCGNHNCSLLCHNGHCPPCRVVSFHELNCECGASVIYPPIPCGTKRPPCTMPCGREHDCDHPVLHHCHSDAQCPPCTMLTEKWCHGKHALRKNVMCHIKNVSCGMPCKRMLSCGRHECSRPCHPDSCLPPGNKCKLVCEKPNAECGHGCSSPCHDGQCPEIKCKVVSDVTCSCGRRQETMICWKREKEYDRLVCYMTNLELKQLRDAATTSSNGGKTENEISAEAVLSTIQAKIPKAQVLECDKECSRVERNRKMMAALQLEDPDATSTFGTPNYSEFLTSFAKKNPQFVENVHDRLTGLVVKAKRSKRKNETYGFESMNRDKRKIVHEYSDHFGCLSESFDEEPNRSVVCTASKDKSYLPAVSLVDAVFRPNICSERKNAFNDVEIFQNTKSQIMRPANGRMLQPGGSTLSPRGSGGMVALGCGGAALAPSTQPIKLAPSANSTFRNFAHPTTSETLPTLPGADFPPLS